MGDVAGIIEELMGGLYTREDIITCIQHFGDGDNVVDFFMQAETSVVHELIGWSGDSKEWTHVQYGKLSKKLNVVEEGSEMHQFTCRNCVRCWWKSVPCDNPVSKCYKCRVWHEPIPRDREWGIGRFKCDCGREFFGFATMTMTKSLCFRCKMELVDVQEICPPLPKEQKDHGRRRNLHNCNGINCYNPNPPENIISHLAPKQIEEWMERNGGNWIPGGCYNEKGEPAICIHPRSRGAMPANVKVRTWSNVHWRQSNKAIFWLDNCSFSTGMSYFSYCIQ